MKAKDLLKALCKSGILEGDIYSGEKIEDGTLRILEGEVVSTNDYFFSSTRIGFEHYDAKIEAKSGTVFFLYSV